MSRFTKPSRVLWAGLLGMLLLAVALGCQGETRPEVEIIPANEQGTETGTGTGTGTATGAVTGTGASPVISLVGTTYYGPMTDVTAHAALALDIRDAAELMAPSKSGQPVDWAAVTDLYQNGKNSPASGGAKRTLASIATSSSVLAQFPGGADLDGLVRAGLEGTGRGQGLSDDARRQLVEKGFSAILYGKTLQELAAARQKVEQGNTDPGGAPHNVDEGWAFYVGAADAQGNRPYALSATAGKREADFGKEGLVDTPLQVPLAFAQQAARMGDLEAFDMAAEKVRGQLNAIFYLASLKYVNSAVKTTEASARVVTLAEGWAFYQTIRPAVASADPVAAAAIEAIYSRDASEAVPASAVDDVYARLNSPAVLKALGIPATLVVTR